MFNPDYLERLIWDMSEKDGMTIKELARRVGKEPVTLDAELNPGLKHGKLGVATWAMCLHETEQLDSLNYIESALGRVAYDLPEKAVSVGLILEELGKAIRSFGKWLEEMAKCTAPDSDGGITITREEARKVLPRLIRLVSLLIGLQVHLAAISNGDEPT